MEIKVEGLDVAIEKLSLKSGDLIILRNVPGDGLRAFREKLMKHLPLDVHVPGIVSLYDDQTISTVNIQAGDTVVLHGEVTQAQFERFKEQLRKEYQASGLQLPCSITLLVERKCRNCGSTVRDESGHSSAVCGQCLPFP